MLKSFARIIHQLIALALLVLILLAAFFALASLSNTTIADVLHLQIQKQDQTRVNNPASQTETSPDARPKALNPSTSLGLVANTYTFESLQSALTTLQQADVDAIFLLGNVTQTGSVDELRAVKTILDGVRLPTYFIPGTNDLKTPFLSSIFGFRPNSQMYQEVDLAGLQLLLLDNADPTIGISPEQWNWLSTTLRADYRPTFIFLHTRNHQDPTTQPQNTELDRLLADATPSAVIDASMVMGVAILDVFEDNSWKLKRSE